MWAHLIGSSLAVFGACSSYDEGVTQSEDGAAPSLDAASLDVVTSSDSGSPPPDALTADADADVDADADAGTDADASPALVTKVAAAPFGACAILADGRVKCWGANSTGQLGVGDSIGRGGGGPGEAMGSALPAVSLGGKRAIDIATGRSSTTDGDGGVPYGFACALLEGGTVVCWGYAAHGQLGQGSGLPIGLTPESMVKIPPINLGGTATKISAGDYSVCALLDSGDVKCWGYNALGELGVGDILGRGALPGTMGSALPAVHLDGKAKGISVGSRYACAVLLDGRVQCWGDNAFGQLGINSVERVGADGGTAQVLPSADLEEPATAVYAGYNSTCARLLSGALKCWGYNGAAGLGLGDYVDRGKGDDAGALRDQPKVDLGPGGGVIDVSLGTWASCALRDDHTAKCWGYNRDGVLGLGDTNQRGYGPNQMGENLSPLPFKDITSISTSHSCTCAVTEGRVKCWGNNAFGQLGQGDHLIRGNAPGFQHVLPFVDLGD